MMIDEDDIDIEDVINNISDDDFGIFEDLIFDEEYDDDILWEESEGSID